MVPKGIVIFDFDGTLTYQRNNMTMWDLLWASSGKSDRGAFLYSQFHNGQISREDWFRETEQEFSGKITKPLIRKVAESVHLRDDATEVFKSLTAIGYELYILSGGIRPIIEETLAESRVYFTEISANNVVFDENGKIVCLEMTPYDYEGKANYIERLIRQTNVCCNNIYYVGNSINDISVLTLPIKTICISPVELSQNQISCWNYQCSDLKSVESVILDRSF